MEISSEIKAKVFAQYLGQRVTTRLRGYDLKQRRTSVFKGGILMNIDLVLLQAGVWLDGEEHKENLTNLDFGTDCKLLLKPVSAINEMQMYKLFSIAYESIFNYSPDVQHKFFGTDGNSVALKSTDRQDGKNYGFSFDGNNFELSMDGNDLRINQAYLFCTVKEMGVDVPIVNGKTLKECDLCTYE